MPAAGAALETIFNYRITELFFSVVTHIPKHYGISARFAEIDSTTISLHGVYNCKEEEQTLLGRVIRIIKGIRRIALTNTIKLQCSSSVPTDRVSIC